MADIVGTLDNIAAHWKLEEASGTRFDETANGYDLTDTGSVAQITGALGNAADYNGTVKHLDLSTNSDFLFDTASPAHGISCSFWFSMNDLVGVQTLISKWDNGSGTFKQEYILYANGSNLVLGIHQGGAVITKSGALSTSTQYHCVFTIDTSGNAALYLNNSKSTGTRTLTTNGGTAGDFQIGCNSVSSNCPNCWIDEVTFTTDVITDGEVTTLYNSGTPLNYEDAGGGYTFVPQMTPFAGL